MASGARNGGIGLGHDVPSPAGFDRSFTEVASAAGQTVKRGAWCSHQQITGGYDQTRGGFHARPWAAFTRDWDEGCSVVAGGARLKVFRALTPRHAWNRFPN
jgi:hypothetical protein